MAKGGRYVREYHSSFYGFANDKFDHKYTIGVLVIRAKKGNTYFASKSAVPTFRKIVQLLVEQGKLIPDPEVIKALEEACRAKEETVQNIIKKKFETKAAKRHPKKKKVKRKLVEPQIPTTAPVRLPVQKLENIEDLF
jgi:cell division protein FtsI (penicillin-binding protein 3)